MNRNTSSRGGERVGSAFRVDARRLRDHGHLRVSFPAGTGITTFIMTVKNAALGAW